MITSEELDTLAADAVQRAPHEAAELLAERTDEDVIAVLQVINPLVGQQILREFDDRRRSELFASAPPANARQWLKNTEYPEDSVGWLMEHAVAVFRPQMTVGDTIEAMRKLTKRAKNSSRS